MHRIPWQSALCAFLDLLALVGPACGMAGRPAAPPFTPGQILVKFHDGVSDERIGEIIREEGGTVDRVIGSTGVYVVVLPEDQGVLESVERYSARPEVRYAEPNYRATPLEER